MALSGMHIVCAGVTAAGTYGPLPMNANWSETLSSAQITTHQVPASGRSIIRVRASADSYVAIGSAPDATNGPRFFVAAATDYDFYANPNDRVAWVLA
jgi:hypothetical protein